MPRGKADRSSAIAAIAEVFREHGYDGASLALISQASGLGKGSLYHFFPGGKQEMMEAVLTNIETWFESAIFTPLETASATKPAIAAMYAQVEAYFHSGGRVCLVGVLSLSAARDPFAEQVRVYFLRWVEALAACLERGGTSQDLSCQLSQEAVAGIQGAIVLSRALGDRPSFVRLTAIGKSRLLEAIQSF